MIEIKATDLVVEKRFAIRCQTSRMEGPERVFFIVSSFDVRWYLPFSSSSCRLQVVEFSVFPARRVQLYHQEYDVVLSTDLFHLFTHYTVLTFFNSDGAESALAVWDE